MNKYEPHNTNPDLELRVCKCDKHDAEIEALKEAFADLSKRIYWLEIKGKACR